VSSYNVPQGQFFAPRGPVPNSGQDIHSQDTRNNPNVSNLEQTLNMLTESIRLQNAQIGRLTTKASTGGVRTPLDEYFEYAAAESEWMYADTHPGYAPSCPSRSAFSTEYG